MAKEQQVSMPQSTGGLIGYGWESGSKIKIPPHIIIIAIIVIAIIVILLNTYGGLWFASG